MGAARRQLNLAARRGEPTPTAPSAEHSGPDACIPCFKGPNAWTERARRTSRTLQQPQKDGASTQFVQYVQRSERRRQAPPKCLTRHMHIDELRNSCTCGGHRPLADRPQAHLH
eukprot:CAMPEP_0198572006 /NCGR_PEP_ID=MMETSP1462-20131121/111269_1 /TAXON_ID=1333877 /ORGANISM="Brandtodinium nutriculum, Strain RCC3387" /LENGTH=113 /DNA_ID=CAMNT_0044303155 /DNA_START=179 /DNA_END=520 /DNA_ORIENTATION=-